MAQSKQLQAQRIIYLASGYINNTLNFAELQELEKWRKEKPANQQLFDELTDTAKQQQAIQRMQQYDTEGSLAKVKQVIQSGNKQDKIISMRWPKALVAAATVILASAVIFLYFRHVPNEQIVSLKPHPQYIAPGSDKAILTLSNGKKITINRPGNGIIATQGGVQISNTTGGSIIYTAANQSTQNMIEYNTIQTPKAGK